MATHEHIEKESTEEFGERMFQNINGGFVTLGLALGSRLGLFDIMAGFNEPKTTQEVADVGGFKERYVREWLGLMVVAKIVDIDQTGQRFYLPEHRRPAVSGGQNMCRVAESVLILGLPQLDLVECFKKDGPSGIPFSRYTGLHDWFHRGNRANQKSTLQDLAEIEPVHKLLESGAIVADLGCGTGITTQHMAEGYPKSTFTGLELEKDAVARGMAEIQELGLSNIKLQVQDICSMPPDWTNKWDCVIMKIVAHDVSHTTRLFKEVYRTLKPGGIVLLVDINLKSNPGHNIDHPYAQYLYGFSLHHCLPTSLSNGEGEGWGATWGREKALELLRGAGISDLELVRLKGECFYCIGYKK